MKYSDIIEVTSMMVNLSVYDECNGKLYKYCDIGDAEESEEYERLQYRKVVWIAIEHGVLCLTIK